MGGYVHYYNVKGERGNIGSRHGISVDAGAVDVHLGRQVHVFEWSMSSVSVMLLRRGLQERNHGWGGCVHLPNVMITTEEYRVGFCALDIQAAFLRRSI